LLSNSDADFADFADFADERRRKGAIGLFYFAFLSA
jgi:hypothetical protein